MPDYDSADVMAITKWTISDSRIGALSNLTDRSPDTQAGCENTSDQNQERPMIRKTIFAVATVAAIGAAALIPTEASAGGGKGGGMGGGHHWGHGHWGGGFGGVVVIGPSCWRWVPGLGRVYVCY
jgi:hypothetical protein